MCHIRYDEGKYDFWVVPVDDTYGEECYRINNSFIKSGEYEALEQRRCYIHCVTHRLCVIQKWCEDAETGFYALFVIVSH